MQLYFKFVQKNRLTPNYEILHTQNGDFIEKKRNKHCLQIKCLGISPIVFIFASKV